METIKFKEFEKQPVPKPGDQIEVRSHPTAPPGPYTILACDCPEVGLEGGWPVTDRCGAHMFHTWGEDSGFICWDNAKGWLCNGLLYRDEIDDLKRQNTKASATNCAKCGSPLKIPAGMPSMKHCPKCEP